jgi:hypothetical protein
VVAIPAVVAYNVAQKKIGEIEANVGSIGKHLLALLKYDPRARSKHLVEEEPERTSGERERTAASVMEEA